jgi:magnesium transporter
MAAASTRTYGATVNAVIELAPSEVALETVAAHATRAVPVAEPDERVDDLMARIRGRRFASAAVATVCVGDRLVGLVTIERLLAAEPSAIVGDVMDPDLPIVAGHRTQEEVVWEALHHNEPGLAVLDDDGNWLGLISPQQLLSVLLEEHDQASFYLADAVDTQTEALIIRGLSVGVSVRRVAVREFITGLLIGALIAIVVYPLTLALWGNPAVSLSVALALLGACTIATLIAMVLPWLLSLFRVDPAFGSGPLATVIQDILSILTYLLITDWIVY